MYDIIFLNVWSKNYDKFNPKKWSGSPPIVTPTRIKSRFTQFDGKEYLSGDYAS